MHCRCITRADDIRPPLVKKSICCQFNLPRWSRGHKAQGQGHERNPRPRLRTALPRTEPLEAKDSSSEDRLFRGQGQECLRPRAKDQGHWGICSPKKRSSKKFFRQFPKNGLQRNFLGDFQTRKTKKVFANFPQGIWRFQTKF